MIYTLTISPAIDYVVQLSHLTIGATNRTSGEEYYFGGKGINVSTILKELGMESVALGFVSGFTGCALEDGLREQGIETDFIHLDRGITRINVKIKGEQETEINSQGAIPSKEDFDRLAEKLQKLKTGDVFILSGSIPKALPQDTYGRLLESIRGKGVHIVVDATGRLLLDTLKYRPFLIKPNIDELRELLGDETEPQEGARILQERGARNVIVSMGKDGAMLLAEDGALYRCGVCSGTIQNTVGAGDSMVAGFVCGYAKTRDWQYALDLGSGAGSATALSQGLAKKEKIQQCFHRLRKDR